MNRRRNSARSLVPTWGHGYAHTGSFCWSTSLRARKGMSHGGGAAAEHERAAAPIEVIGQNAKRI